jgi:propionate CoA-transferase
MLDEYSDMVRDLAQTYYSRATRYTTSAFLRVKLGEALRQRGLAPHIFESAERARADLDNGS